jgi:hypothetical protein
MREVVGITIMSFPRDGVRMPQAVVREPSGGVKSGSSGQILPIRVL